MIDWKEVLNAFGGGKTVSLGALLLVFVYVAGDRYVVEQAQSLRETRSNQAEIIVRLSRVEYLLEAPRFTQADGETLKALILQNRRDFDKLERRVERITHE